MAAGDPAPGAAARTERIGRRPGGGAPNDPRRALLLALGVIVTVLT
ncbi:MAG: hypothetical protein ACRD2W_12910 [Acidimicrobiales bacterium]